MKKLIAKFSSNSVAKSGIIVFAGTMVMNISAYVYHLLMGRYLGPTGYGELSSLFSLLYILNVPLLVGQTVLVKFVSAYKAKNELGQTKSLLILVTKYFAVACIAVLPLVLIFAPVLSGFLHLKSSLLIVLVYIMFIFALLSIAMMSVLQGLQLFIWSSILGAGGLVLRVLVSIPMAVWGVVGVMWAAVLATLLSYATYFYPLKFLFRIKAKPVEIRLHDAVRFTIPTFITLLGITSIYSTDIMLVRHYFSATDAGLYAALAVLGKIIFYASSAVTTVLFSVIAERTASGQNIKKHIYTCIGIVGLISFTLCLLFFLFPGFIVHALFGNAYTQASGLLGLFGLFLGLFSIGNSLSLISLAAGKTHVWIFSAIAAVVQIFGIILYHQSIESIIWLNIWISLFFAGGSFMYLFRSTHEKI